MKQLEWLSPEDIKNEVYTLLERYNQEFDDKIKGEVPVERIAEFMLDLRFDLDTPSNLGLDSSNKKIWGSTYPDGKVFINEELMTEKYPEGRYRFTVAHEIGHWILHQAILQGKKGNNQTLFREGAVISNLNGGQTILCRQGDKSSAEWQADKFAAFLLMPPKKIKPLYKKLHKKYEKQTKFLKGKLQRKISYEIADKFNTSVKATRIHLKELNLKAGQLSLF